MPTWLAQLSARGPYTAEELFEQVAQAGAVAYKGCGAARFDSFDAPCLGTTFSKALSCATIAGAVVLGGRQEAVCASAGWATTGLRNIFIFIARMAHDTPPVHPQGAVTQ